MAVFRIERTQGFTTMSNHHLHNKALSCKAKGLMAFMLSLPDDWDYSERGLAACLKDGRDGIRAGLKELESEGYLVRNQVRGEDGRVTGVEYCIYEIPQGIRNVENIRKEPWPENPATEKPASEKPVPENTPNKILKYKNTKKQKITKPFNQSIKEIEENIKVQINYEWVRSLREVDKQRLENIVDILVELKSLAEASETVIVGKESYPAELVLRKLDKLDSTHIQYVMECLRHHKKKVNNIKAFLQKSLLNAPDTIDSYYYAEVQHDFYGRG